MLNLHTITGLRQDSAALVPLAEVVFTAGV